MTGDLRCKIVNGGIVIHVGQRYAIPRSKIRFPQVILNVTTNHCFQKLPPIFVYVGPFKLAGTFAWNSRRAQLLGLGVVGVLLTHVLDTRTFLRKRLFAHDTRVSFFGLMPFQMCIARSDISTPLFAALPVAREATRRPTAGQRFRHRQKKNMN